MSVSDFKKPCLFCRITERPLAGWKTQKLVYSLECFFSVQWNIEEEKTKLQKSIFLNTDCPSFRSHSFSFCISCAICHIFVFFPTISHSVFPLALSVCLVWPSPSVLNKSSAHFCLKKKLDKKSDILSPSLSPNSPISELQAEDGSLSCSQLPLKSPSYTYTHIAEANALYAHTHTHTS